MSLSTLPCLTLPYLTLPYLILPYLTLPYLTLPYLTLPYLTLLTLPYLTLPYLLRQGVVLDGSRCEALGSTILVRWGRARLEGLQIQGFGVRVYSRAVVEAEGCSLDGPLAHWTTDGGGVIKLSGGSITTGVTTQGAPTLESPIGLSPIGL